MKAQELRIGNLIMWDDESHDIEYVKSIIHFSDDEFEIKFKSGSAMLGEFKPIPLDAKWFKILGWKKERTDWEYEGYWFTKGRKWTISATNEFYNGVYSQKIEYVHQLQNLYYALTGKELELVNSEKI